MSWTISPDSYDVVVIGSGIPECLVAASLVKSGKSVLIIDAVDTYGTDFASFTPAALHDYLCKQQQKQATNQQPETLPDGCTSAPVDAVSSPEQTDRPQQQQQQQPQRHEDHEHSMPANAPISGTLPPGSRLVRLHQRPLPLSGIRVLSVPADEGGEGAAILTDRRRYILDLAPKLVYQAEALVDLLVRCRCHHYLEFKAVEGSYILQDGAPQPVPAGRADIFRDRRLSLADKRVLMRFIQGCMEARSGQGHLKDVLSSSRPLVEVLRDEGLTRSLREVILYGIAMADTDQDPPSEPAASAAGANGAPAASDADAASSASPPAGDSATEDDAAAAAASSSGGGGSGGGPGGSPMTGAAGGAALELFTSSQGRFGQQAVFMLPSYGCGSVAEAFVRLCAVHGAVTVLRQPVQALVLAAAGAGAGAAARGAVSSDPASAEGPRSTAATEPGQRAQEATAGAAEAAPGLPASAAADPVAGVSDEDREGSAAAAVALAGRHSGDGSREGGAAEACVGIVTAAGQVVRCGAVVAGVSTLSCLEGTGPASSVTPSEPKCVSRAVVVLDGPLLPASKSPSPAQGAAVGTGAAASAAPPPPSLLTLVVPPRCPGVAGGSGGAGGGNPHAVRALQQGASTCVCPAGRFLLYLSTPASASSSYDDLRPALDLLADTSRLRDATGTGTNPDPDAGSAVATSSPSAPDAAAASADPGSSAAPSRPRALHAWFYRQPVLHSCSGMAATGAKAGEAATEAGGERLALTLPCGVVALPGSDGSLAGYDAVLSATEAAFRLAFPGATWLAEADFTPSAADGDEEGGGAAGGGGGGGAVDDDEDAIDELSAAVARLKDA